MKKTLIIALCCITVLFAACKKEKPYEKFIGNYDGTVLVNGALKFPFFPQLNKEINNEPFELNFALTQGETDDQVILTYAPSGQNQTFTTTGNIKDNFVDFAPIIVNQDIDQSHLNASIDLEGTLANDELALTGTLTGNGSLKTDEMTLSVDYTIEGTMAGSVKKEVAPKK